MSVYINSFSLIHPLNNELLMFKVPEKGKNIISFFRRNSVSFRRFLVIIGVYKLCIYYIYTHIP